MIHGRHKCWDVAVCCKNTGHWPLVFHLIWHYVATCPFQNVKYSEKYNSLCHVRLFLSADLMTYFVQLLAINNAGSVYICIYADGTLVRLVVTNSNFYRNISGYSVTQWSGDRELLSQNSNHENDIPSVFPANVFETEVYIWKDKTWQCDHIIQTALLPHLKTKLAWSSLKCTILYIFNYLQNKTLRPIFTKYTLTSIC